MQLKRRFKLRRVNIIPKRRALVLQEGDSLGAYEAGAYRAIYEFLSKRDADEGKKGRSTFNIVAGTSIGAITAAVLVSYVVENQTYEGSAETYRFLELLRNFCNTIDNAIFN